VVKKGIVDSLLTICIRFVDAAWIQWIYWMLEAGYWILEAGSRILKAES
jgi:hypothetical protein